MWYNLHKTFPEISHYILGMQHEFLG